MKKNTKAQGADNKVYSAALNNLNYLSGSVDPQTCFFSSVITFGNLIGDRSLGARFKLQMAFGALNTLSGENHNMLGLGWSMALPGYDRGTSMITFPDGRAYKIKTSGSDWVEGPEIDPDCAWTTSHKLKDVEVFGNYDNGNETVTILTKDGTRYLLAVDSGGYGYLVQIIAPDGRYLLFKQKRQAEGIYRLERVTDTSGQELLTVTPDTTYNTTTLVMNPDTPAAQTFLLEFNNDGTLTSVSMEAGKETLTTAFDYEKWDLATQDGGDSTMVAIQQVTHASGATEVIQYDNRLELPSSFPWRDGFPAVSTYTRRNGLPEEEIVHSYTLDERGHNFFGNKLKGIEWENAADSLANCVETDYRYVNTVVEGKLKCTRHSYNKFHQPVLQEQWFLADLSQVRVTTFTYYSDESLQLDAEEQDCRYELLRMQTDTLQEGPSAISLVVETEFDDHGNLQRKTNIDGTVEAHSYYPAAGEVDAVSGATLCPAHPFGMVAFCKESTLLPAPTGGVAVSKITARTYKLLGSMDPAGSPHVVLATEDQDGQVTTSTYHGEDGNVGSNHGLLREQTVTCEEITHTLSYDYDFEVETCGIKRTETIVGFDGCTGSRSETKSWLTEWVLAETDLAGVTSTYSYDSVGRVILKHHATGSDYASTTSYAYIPLSRIQEGDAFAHLLAEVGAGWLVMEANDAELRSSQIVYDGGKNERQRYLRHADGKHYKIAEKFYDALGRVREEYGYDYDPTTASTYTAFTRYTHGAWGAQCESIDSSGLIMTTQIDPFQLQVTRQYIRRDDTSDPTKVTASRHAARTTYNLFGSELGTEVLDASNKVVSASANTYDGFGRKCSITSPSGHTMHLLDYDAFDRPRQVQHADGFLYQFAFSPGSTRPRVSSVTFLENIALDSEAKTFEIGVQTWDGLERVQERTVLGVKTRFGYEGAMRQASRVVNARQQTTLLKLIPELGNVPSRIATFGTVVENNDGGWGNASKQSESAFTYGSKSSSAPAPLGQLVAATTAEDAQEYRYNAAGTMTGFMQRVGDRSKTTTVSKATVQGKILEINIEGRTVQLTYDAQGSLAEMTDGNLRVVLAPDPLGGLSQECIYVEGVLMQQTDIVGDAQGREKSRTIHALQHGYAVTYGREYEPDGKMCERKTSILKAGKSVGEMTESYVYDTKRRLSNFDAVASDQALLPRDAQGHPFHKQEFSYDPLDNLRSVTTTFPNGEQDIASYAYQDHRLHQISHTLVSGANAYLPVMEMGYDADGNLICMGEVRMDYTVPGRLQAYGGNAYRYDALQRMTHTGTHARYYMHALPIADDKEGSETRFIRMGDAPVAEVTDGRWTLYGKDQSASVVMATTEAAATQIAYGPQGSSDHQLCFGFNGELRDAQSGIYHLGNGVRGYHPQLGGFLSIDSFSPFQGGGLNPYSYCNGDPVNFADPSGHISSGAKLGLDIFFLFVDLAAIGLAVFTGGSSLSALAVTTIVSSSLGAVSSVLSIAGDSLKIQDEQKGTDHSETVDKLGLASTVFGLASLATGGLELGLENVDDIARAGKTAQKARKTMAKADTKPTEYRRAKWVASRNDKRVQNAKANLSDPKEWGKSLLKGVTGYDARDFSGTVKVHPKLSELFGNRPKLEKGYLKASGPASIVLKTSSFIYFASSGTWSIQAPETDDLPQNSYNTPDNG